MCYADDAAAIFVPHTTPHFWKGLIYNLEWREEITKWHEYLIGLQLAPVPKNGLITFSETLHYLMSFIQWILESLVTLYIRHTLKNIYYKEICCWKMYYKCRYKLLDEKT